MKSLVRPNSIRNLSGFMGEITAYIAGVEVALLEAQGDPQKNDEKKWENIAKSHSIHLGGVSPDSLLLSHSRMSILCIYSAFDSYIGALRKEYLRFHDKQWVQNDGDTPFQALNRNCKNKEFLTSKKIESYLTVIDYYRVIRNIVAHPREGNTTKPDEFYEKNKEHLNYIREELSTATAPNKFDSLTFEDVKVFARLVLFAADIINTEFSPSYEQIAKKIPKKYQFKNLAHDSVRRKKSISSYLRMEYGLKPEVAESITNVFLAHQLNW